MYITFDTDWANDDKIDICLDFLKEHNARGTFFITNNCEKSIKRMRDEGHELAIHPNLRDNLKGSSVHFAKVIDDLLAFVPDAKGVRFHSLAYGNDVLEYCASAGLLYDSSIYCPHIIPPYKDYCNIKRIHFHWADSHALLESKDLYSESKKELSENCVLIFHPVHIYINTRTISDYELYKIRKDPPYVAAESQTKYGVRDFFLNTLNQYNNFGVLSDLI